VCAAHRCPCTCSHPPPAGGANPIFETANLGEAASKVEDAAGKLENKLGSTADAIKNINLFPDVRGDKPNTCECMHKSAASTNKRHLPVALVIRMGAAVVSECVCAPLLGSATRE
jgi:hypothetical protein